MHLISMLTALTMFIIFSILGQADASEESLLLDGVSALLIFCRSNRFKMQGMVYMGHKARKPVFGVSDKASFKQVSSATETS